MVLNDCLVKILDLKKEFGAKLNPPPPKISRDRCRNVTTKLYRYYRQLVTSQKAGAGKSSKVAPLQCARRQAEIFTACIVHRLGEGYTISETCVSGVVICVIAAAATAHQTAVPHRSFRWLIFSKNTRLLSHPTAVLET